MDAAWKDGKLTEATIRSKQGGSCAVYYKDKKTTLETKAGKSYRLNGDLVKM